MYFYTRLGADTLKEKEEISINTVQYVKSGGILRQLSLYSDEQLQTSDCFGYKWGKRDTYESDSVKKNAKQWELDRYFDGDVSLARSFLTKGGNFLDAGCGSGFSASLLFGATLNQVNYFGVDISQAVDIAESRFLEENISGEFLQGDISNLPFSGPTFDVIFSEGVLHHTDSTQETFKYLVTLLKPGGKFLFYVYKRKAPIREFADDYIRQQLSYLSDEEAWKVLYSITKLGQELGNKKINIDIQEDIPLLEIPAGSYDLQRFFYWYFLKAFFREDFSTDEMNHINFDWYRPKNCHRHTKEEIEVWCYEAGMVINRMKVEEAGITVIATRIKSD